MPLFVAEHQHPADRCPAKQPEMAAMLLQLVSKSEAAKHGIKIQADAVTDGRHHLYLIVEAPGPEAVQTYFAPFAQAGSLNVAAASPCEKVVDRGGC